MPPAGERRRLGFLPARPGKEARAVRPAGRARSTGGSESRVSESRSPPGEVPTSPGPGSCRCGGGGGWGPSDLPWVSKGSQGRRVRAGRGPGRAAQRAAQPRRPPPAAAAARSRDPLRPCLLWVCGAGRPLILTRSPADGPAPRRGPDGEEARGILLPFGIKAICVRPESPDGPIPAGLRRGGGPRQRLDASAGHRRGGAMRGRAARAHRGARHGHAVSRMSRRNARIRSHFATNPPPNPRPLLLPILPTAKYGGKSGGERGVGGKGGALRPSGCCGEPRRRGGGPERTLGTRGPERGPELEGGRRVCPPGAGQDRGRRRRPEAGHRGPVPFWP